MEEKQNFIGVNTDYDFLKFDNFSQINFKSRLSYLDYDAVIINANNIPQLYPQDSFGAVDNKYQLSKKASFDIIEDLEYVKGQIEGLLKQGKNIYVFISQNDNCCIYTGETSVSGTGRNAKTTNYVRTMNSYSFLPFMLKVSECIGEKMTISCGEPYRSFFKKTINIFFYRAYFKIDYSKYNNLINIDNTDHVVAAEIPLKNGRIILLPKPCDKNAYDSEQDWKKDIELYFQELFLLNQRLTASTDDYEMPEWANDFTILSEKRECDELSRYLERLTELQKKIEIKNEEIKRIQKYKTLITATGNHLEDIVKQVLSEIGFQIQSAEKGRSDIIAKFNDTDIVAEIKGVSKSAAEKHAAQLEKWVAQFIEENENTPKALLIVNAYNNTPVFDRTEDVFPDQMLKYCKNREHILLSTTQLLCLYIDITNHPEKKDDLINELLATVGVYNKYTDITQYLKPKFQEVNDV